MKPLSKHHWLIYPFFKFYITCIVRRNFRCIVFDDQDELEAIKNEKPLLVIANHSSWWDGFWVEYLNCRFLHRKFHVIVEEKQLKKYPYFRKTGGFSIPEDRDSRSALNYACNLLSDRERLLLVFPSGVLESMHKKEVTYKKGVQYLYEHSLCDVLMINHIVDYGSHKKPALFVYTHFYHRELEHKVDILMKFEEFLRGSMKKHINGKVWH